MHPGMGPEYFWWGGMWVFPLIMILVMLLVVYLLFGRGGLRPPWWHPDDRHAYRQDSETPLEILKRRYAKGEITREEFERMKNDVMS